MCEKLFNHGLIVGKFQPITIAQKNIIRTLYSMCNQVSIVVETKENSYDYCLSNIEEIYEPLNYFLKDIRECMSDIIVYKSRLSTNCDNVERLVSMQHSISKSGYELSQMIKPDVVAYGDDETKFFYDSYFTDMTHLRFTRDQFPMSGTEVRNMFLFNITHLIVKYTGISQSIWNHDILKFREEMLKYPEAQKILEETEKLNLIHESKNPLSDLQVKTIKTFRECTGIGFIEARKYLTLHNWNIVEAYQDVNTNYSPIHKL